MITYLFPGQGSQHKGMGENLFSEFPDITQQADAILGYSISTLCLADPEQKLNQTQFTQPALYTVNALSYLKKIKDTKRRPDFVLGHSLGEYNALFAAGVFDFATGLRLVQKRGELMSQEKNGAMAAVIGMKINELENFLDNDNNVSIANHNSYLQTVISGLKNNLDTSILALQKLNSVTVIPLKVSGAFHSPCMQPAQEKFTEFLNQFTFSVPALPVLANINAEIYHPATIKKNLSAQLAGTVRWTSSIEALLAYKNMEFEELGPGKVLSGLVQKIKNNT
ncbi:MAG: ACP S-malonyltransferase [Gammaproteobacteria bacterium]|nr:ACP S-malonyltransferase [Gammaproteobacteria bacterium]